MKAITIKEPYASLIATNQKHYEFRSWNTKYRGTVLIHAAKIPYKDYQEYNVNIRPSEIVAQATITDVIKLNEDVGNKIYEENPLVYGKHADGYAWVLTNIKPLNNHTKYQGKLSFWSIDYEE